LTGIWSKAMRKPGTSMTEILRYCFDAGIILLLVLSLWVPDIQKVLGRVLVWDQFRNWDGLIMLPGWAYTHGLGLNTDIISSWGMGAVVWVSRWAQILGGFDYAHVLEVLMAMVILYYGLLYAFLRMWLRSVLLAAAVLAVAVKIQMFHAGISPLIWIFPQDTPVRHWLDIPVLWCLWQHARGGQNKYLPWAASAIGAALAWQLSTGACLLAAFWGYLIFLLMIPGYRALPVSGFHNVRRILFYCFLPLVVMGLLLFLIQGSAVFHLEFWKNTFEPFQLFLKGVGTVSIFSCLYDRHFFAFITGFVVPVIYAWTLLIMASAVYSKKTPCEELFLVPLCVYGLGLYLHYIAHGSISHYYAVGIPLVMVIGYWSSKMVTWFSGGRQLKFLLLLSLGAWGALFTNIFFVYYPNIFNISRMDWNPEINVYQSQFHFDQDAAMIARLVPKTQRAALISSFEASLLMQAKRTPFFYYTPLIESEPLNINGFVGTSVITQERLDKTIKQIAQQSPDYIFIEKRLFSQWPPGFVQYFPGIARVLLYINEHYQPQEQGEYLIAMHRK
jgi:hypothetical protein